MARSGRRRSAGVTVVEMMVVVGISGVIFGFIFMSYARLSTTFNVQSRIAETQQVLRAATDIIARDVRMAGYMATRIGTAGYGGLSLLAPVTIDNGGGTEGSDTIMLVYADGNSPARIMTTGPAFPSAESEVSTIEGFNPGDVLLGVRICPGPPGSGCESLVAQGCFIEVTNVQNIGGDRFRLQHHPSAPWNVAGNHQCDHLSGCWADGCTVFTHYGMHLYRIKPADPRGVLQVSRSGGIIDDWQDLTDGIVDLQVALQVLVPGDGADSDGDGDAELDWYSGDAMETVQDLAGAQLVKVSLSLVGRSRVEIDAPAAANAPSLIDTAHPANNELGDHSGVALPVTDPTSRFYGNHVYRTETTFVDVRNLGFGS